MNRTARASVAPDSLAAALTLAADAVAAVNRGSALPEALLKACPAGTAPEARGAAQDISYRCMRRLGAANAVIALTTRRAPSPPSLMALLQCAIALLLDPERPYEPFTVVDQAVDAVAADARTAHAKGMVNAVLRRLLRERDELTRKLSAQRAAVWNYPQWWISATEVAWPRQWQSVLAAGNAAPPLTLRINRRRSSVDDYLTLLEQHGMQGIRLGPQAVRVLQPVPVARLPGFADGVVSVQDAAAQLSAPLLDLHDGLRVLDACAAPGGKTGHMLELAQLDLTALDIDAARLARVRDNLDRLGLHAQLLTGDAAGTSWWDGKPFDRILADVPCTASGIVRRHPDIRWLRRPDDTHRLARLAASILDNLWPMLAPGGLLLLATCSIWPEESEQQAQRFARHTGADRLPAPGQLLPATPPPGLPEASSGADAQQDHDGLFHALFQKPLL